MRAPVTLLEYGDFECPFCGRAYTDLKRIRERLADQLRFVYGHFPRPEHAHAREAAEAAECAAAQGEHRFWTMHDVLFEHQQALEDRDLVKYASQLGLDTRRFSRDMADHTYLQRVQQDLEGGLRSRVRGTPTFFINGQRYEGRACADGLYRALLWELGGEFARPGLFDEVDEAAADSFPASDPPGWIASRL